MSPPSVLPATGSCKTMLRFSITLLLTATFLLVNADFPTETVTTCAANSVHRLSCDTGVINVETALYGRADNVTCSEGTARQETSDTSCPTVSVTASLGNSCNGKRVCEVNSNIVSELNPCPHTSKYLQTKYTCVPARKSQLRETNVHKVTCEHSLAHLQCDEGQVLMIYYANYGRHDRRTCIHSWPTPQIQNTDCSRLVTQQVSDRCAGKNSCIVRAGNSVFGDPCFGIYKYLDVSYRCLYRITEEETLLAATCSLFMTAVVSTERAITCADSFNVHRLSCDIGVIIVEAALYGRADNETCSAGRPPQQLANTDCYQEGTVDILKRRCDGKKVCELNINSVQASDPCNGIYKYLETNYTCFPAIHFATCEHSLAHLQCDEGQVIFVYGADYGRRDMTTCSYKRPASQIANVHCTRHTSRVADSCNGKNSCTVRVSNSLFGDPCGGTYKYLEVAYICEYPVVIPNQSV
ncbi:L-rhamnose-binding lectin CSL1-like [Pagrus major]|uniref:L-rhamnose-binding lectin CSL1-like n=1 Tax=Pagrus major TaxID=143350 RepID=UPI003CC847BF